MPALMKMPHTHLNSFHQSNSLLFQFILNDFLIALRAVKGASEQSPLDYKSIVEAMTQLSGSTQHYMRLFSWNFDLGILAKLRSYSAFISDSMSNEDPDLTAIHRCADQAWFQSVECLTKARSEDPTLNLDLVKLSARMHRFGDLLGKAALQFSDDENVVYFFLRHYKEFDELILKGFVCKLLNKMYPHGIAEAEKFLLKRYSVRGFNNLLANISAKIAELS